MEEEWRDYYFSEDQSVRISCDEEEIYSKRINVQIINSGGGGDMRRKILLSLIKTLVSWLKQCKGMSIVFWCWVLT